MSPEPRAPWASGGAAGSVRMHYACATCRQVREDRGEFLETVIRTGHLPMRVLRKPCCFCKTRIAIARVRTTSPADCPIGHIAPERLGRLANEAFNAAAAAFEQSGFSVWDEGDEPTP